MICSRCSALPVQDPSFNDSIQHYSTFVELEKSVQDGCQICALFRMALLEFYAHGLSISVEEAEQYQRQLDRNSERREGKNPGLREGDLDENLEPTSFFTEINPLKIDSNFAPYSQGLPVIMYLRKIPGEDSAPVNDIYPYVKISSLPKCCSARVVCCWKTVTAMADIQLAKSWLNDCVGSHEICPKSLKSRLTSRILDLGPHEGSSDLRLMVDVKIYGSYATLSHCWGKSQPLQLTKSTYEEFQKKIMYNSLPKTFQDAVTATRSLGLKYLWIDSLCIIQGCKRDWEEQCTEMRRIYKDSFVTLAGPAASDCQSGFLDARQISPHATLQVSKKENSSEVVLSYVGVSDDLGDLVPEPNSALSKRAWVLQERLLSSRVLYFGSKGMYFECFTNVRFENCHYPISWDYQSIDMVEKLSIDKLGSHSKCFNYWEILVQTYSTTDLTKMTDRLPALSGLASEFQRVTKAQYLAGSWLEDMPRTLAWYILFFNHVNVLPSNSASDYIAPSWSWASAKLGVQFACGGYHGQFHSGLEINHKMALAGLDPFGAVECGYIEVSGSLQTWMVQRLPDIMIPERHTLYLKSSNPEGSILATYAPDDISKVLGPKLEVLLLYLGRYSPGQALAMAIEPVDGQYNTYRRIGLALTEEPGCQGIPSAFRDIFRDVGQSLVRLV